MITYERWNQAIISYCFADCDKDEIVFLNTTREVLLEIASQFDFDCEDVEGSLAQAVRSKVISGDRVNLWGVDPTKFPSQVAFLALTVLAASRMESDETENISRTNYYIRLNELLFGKSEKGKPQGLNYSEFEGLWALLQEWARERHDVELHLTVGPSNRKYAWYPISQCLLNKHDQRAIYRFFQDAGLKPDSHITNNHLLSKLRSWVSSTTFSARIRQLLYDDTPYSKLILSQIRALLRNWDGELEPSRTPGKRRNHVKINVQLRFDQFGDVQVRYWFRRRGESKIHLRPNPLGIDALHPLDDTWFQPFTVPNDHRSFWNLHNQLELRDTESRTLIFTLKASDIWVFRRAPERDDGWLNQRNLRLHESHLVVFREWLSGKIISFLEQVCERKIESPKQICVDGREEGWKYITGVKPTVLKSSPSELPGLSVTTPDCISFIGGLSVKDEFGNKCYLHTCLPTVLVPDLGISDEPLYIEDKAVSVPASRHVDLGQLNPDVYHLSYGGSQRILRVLSPTRSLGHEKRSLVIDLDKNAKEPPIFLEREISEIVSQSGLWLAGAKFFGTDIPQTTWAEAENAPQVTSEPNQSLKSPAHLISSVVRAAIELKQDTTSVPEWLSGAIDLLEQNVALRSLVEKRLRRCGETALSYGNLRTFTNATD